MIAMKATAIGNQRPPNGLNSPSQSAGFVVDPSSNPSNFPLLRSSSYLPSSSSSSLPPPSNWLAQRQPKLNGQQIVAERGGGGHHQNRLGLPDLPAGLLSEEDLEGGKLTNVEEREEIDPEDGCKIQIWTYHILSADGMEESTITKRRKLKVNCTQSLKRVEFTNGKETKYEEKAVIDNLDSLGQQNSLMNGRRNCAVPPGQFSGTRPSIEFSGDGEENLTAQNDDESKEISHMLLQTQDNFLMLLREKKDALVKMFPELFSNLRTFPAIFNLIPSTVMETVVNEDGSTTTRTKCSKAFSSHYTRQETFINGIRKESKSRFRAFMEYAGPEGGFCIRLNDNPEADLSEDEGVGNELEDGSGGSTSSDGRSRISSSGRSELTDIQSALGTTGGKGPGGQLCLVEGKEAARRREKAWHAVNEMVESEERYVQKLGLLDKFRSEVERARVLDRRQMGQLFANIASLHQFHEQHLLPQLMDRRREWQSTRRISDVLRKQAPFLKMYSEYTNNYKSATQIYEECARRKRAFEEIVKRVEQLPECEHLSLVSHLICPVQRVMRYQLLLKEYQKYLTPNDVDWQDTEMALSLVMEAASHANEMMRKLDRYRNVLEVQEHLGNILVLVSPGRELLTRSRLNKCSSSTGKVEERILFVFNDLFLLASERSTLIGGIGAAKYKLRAIFAAKHTQIYEGDNLELENSFYLRGADSSQGPQRCVELYCGSQAEKNALFDTVWAVIQEAHSHEAGAHSTASLKHAAADQQKKSCARCDTDFGWYTRQFACQRCGQRFCKRCIEQKPHRMCVDCHRTAEGIRSKSEGVAISQTRKNLLQISANNDDGIIKASFVTFRGPSAKQLQRFFVLRRDFCLYSYRNDMDRFALAMLPLSGCDIGVHQQEKFGITMKHLNRVYLLICANESDHAEWLAALLLSANAKLPGEHLAHPDEDEMDGGGGIKKRFSSGRQNSVQKKEAQKPKNSFASLNPLSSLIRRSASMGDQRVDQVEMAMARERVRELNAKNAAVANQKNKDQQQFKQMQQDCADENGTTFRF